jgi:superfamily I DNA/RNA helicase
MKTFEKAFQDHRIPYQTVGGTPFFQQPPVKKIIDILKFLQNSSHPFLKRKISNTYNINPNQLLSEYHIFNKNQWTDNLRSIIDYYGISAQSINAPIYERVMQIADQFNHPETFIRYATLGKEGDSYNENIESVSIMSIHASKGLEFKCVFIAGCEEGLLPFSLFKTLECDIAEEKRLLYVGMTRAQKFLYLTYAKKRDIFGKIYNLEKSRFIDNIENELFEMQQNPGKKKPADATQLRLF